MGIGAVLSELADSVVIEVLASLCLVIIVRDVHELHVHFLGQRLKQGEFMPYVLLASELVLPVSEMTLGPDVAPTVLLIVLAKRCLEELIHCRAACEKWHHHRLLEGLRPLASVLTSILV